jgi:hypothetical protein
MGLDPRKAGPDRLGAQVLWEGKHDGVPTHWWPDSQIVQVEAAPVQAQRWAEWNDLRGLDDPSVVFGFAGGRQR